MPDDTRIDAPVIAVTVFADGARVTRSAQVTLRPGRQSVLISDLPAGLDPASVRVAARGSGLALLDVDVSREVRPDPLRAEAARLRSDVDRCHDAVQVLDDEDAAEQARLQFLGHLSESAATALARAIGFGRGGHDDLARMGDHLAEGTGGALGRRRDIAARRRAAQRDLEAAQERLAAADGAGRATAEFTEVSAGLEAAAETTATVELSYHVPGASWRPLYDVSLRGERLAVSYLAEVTQRTGEDWPEVELALSTARRGAAHGLPELRPWYIGRAVHAFATAASAQPLAAGPLPPMAALTAQAAPAPTARPAGPEPAARPLTAEVGEAGAGQVFRVQRPLAVPADGGPHKTTVAEFEFEAKLDHLTIPVLGAEAYVRATVTNGSPLLMLPGPARVFHDAEFVGSTVLPVVAAGEEFEVQLGVDDQIRVERELKRRRTSKAALGGSRTIDIGYEITVENHRTGRVDVTVQDHIPVSTDADIKVRLREASPTPAEQTDLGELTWELALEPGRTATVAHRFTVEHPAGVAVTGLR